MNTLDKTKQEKLEALKNRIWQYDFDHSGDIEKCFEEIIDILIGRI